MFDKRGGKMQKLRKNIIRNISGIEDKELLEHIDLLITEYLDYFSQKSLTEEDLKQFLSVQD